MKKITLEVKDVDSIKTYKFEPGDYILTVLASGYTKDNLIQVLEFLEKRGIRLHVLLEAVPGTYNIMEVPKKK